MSNSSQQDSFSITSDDFASLKLDDIITLSSTDILDTSNINTITLTGTGVNYANQTYSYGGNSTTYNTSGISTITLGPLTSDDIKINFPEEWKDCFPSWQRIEGMCKQYPALEIALRNFRTVYELVKDDYDNPAPKR